MFMASDPLERQRPVVHPCRDLHMISRDKDPRRSVVNQFSGDRCDQSQRKMNGRTMTERQEEGENLNGE